VFVGACFYRSQQAVSLRLDIYLIASHAFLIAKIITLLKR